MTWQPPGLLRVALAATWVLAVGLILLALLDHKRVPVDHPDFSEHARMRSRLMLAASGLMVASLLLPAVRWWGDRWRDRRRRRRALSGLCPSCGYSLTANASGTCPECGTAVKGVTP